MHAPVAMPRRAALRILAAPLLVAPWLAACVEEPPPATYKPLDFAYLPKLRLDVASVDIEDSWSPGAGGDGKHVEQQSPVQPLDALRRMGQDRVVASGSSGHATFVIDDASLSRMNDRYEADFAVHLDVSSGDGTRTGYAEARISRTMTIVDYSPEGTRRGLYDLVKAAMDDMNVEFEYQVRRSLKDWLQNTTGSAPEPAPVEQQTLDTPPKE